MNETSTIVISDDEDDEIVIVEDSRSRSSIAEDASSPKRVTNRTPNYGLREDMYMSFALMDEGDVIIISDDDDIDDEIELSSSEKGINNTAEHKMVPKTNRLPSDLSWNERYQHSIPDFSRKDDCSQNLELPDLCQDLSSYMTNIRQKQDFQGKREHDVEEVSVGGKVKKVKEKKFSDEHYVHSVLSKTQSKSDSFPVQYTSSNNRWNADHYPFSDQSNKGFSCTVSFKPSVEMEHKKITSEKQAVSYPVHTVELVTRNFGFSKVQSHENNENEIKNMAPSKLREKTILERQACSSPRQMTCTIVTPDILERSAIFHFSATLDYCHRTEDSHSESDQSESKGCCYFKADGEQHCQDRNDSHPSHKQGHSVHSNRCTENKDSSHFVWDGNSSLSSEMAHLERNKVLGPLSSVYLPVRSIQHGNSQLTCYYRQFVRTALEDEGNIDVGLSLLRDFTSKYSADEDIIDHLLDVWLGKEPIMTEKYQCQFHSTFLSLYQRHPQIKPATLRNLSTCLSSLSMSNFHHRTYQLQISVFLRILELNFFSRNLCNALEIRQSGAYSLLSWEKNRSQLNKIVGLLPQLCHGKATHEKVTCLTHLQHFIHLGLECSVKDQFIALQNIVSEMKSSFLSLKDVEEKILLLSTIDNPWITFSLMRKILEEGYIYVPHIKERFPTPETVVKCYFGAIPKKVRNPSVDCEELAILLYYAVWSCIECVISRVQETKRARLLNPGFEQCKGVINFKRKDLIQHLKEISSHLTSSTYLYVNLIDCVLSSVTSVDDYSDR